MSIGPTLSVVALSTAEVAKLKEKKRPLESAAKALNDAQKKPESKSIVTSHKVKVLAPQNLPAAAAAAMPLTTFSAEDDIKAEAEISKKLKQLDKPISQVYAEMDKLKIEKEKLENPVPSQKSSPMDSEEESSQKTIAESPKVAKNETILKAEKEIRDSKLKQIEARLATLETKLADLRAQQNALYAPWGPILARIKKREQEQASPILTPGGAASPNATKPQSVSGKASAPKSAAAAAKKASPGPSLHISQSFSQFSA